MLLLMKQTTHGRLLIITKKCDDPSPPVLNAPPLVAGRGSFSSRSSTFLLPPLPRNNNNNGQQELLATDIRNGGQSNTPTIDENKSNTRQGEHTHTQEESILLTILTEGFHRTLSNAQLLHLFKKEIKT